MILNSSGKHFFYLFLFFGLASCFGGGIDKRGSVKDYRDGVVLTEGGSFRVGALPGGWVRQSFKYRAVVFSHSSRGSSVSVDAFCKRSFDDAPLPILSNQLYYGMTEQTRRLRRNILVDGRQALRTVRSGRMDGILLYLDTVVFKANGCVFDFAYTATPKNYSFGISDFKNFVKGFHLIQGPRID